MVKPKVKPRHGARQRLIRRLKNSAVTLAVLAAVGGVIYGLSRSAGIAYNERDLTDIDFTSLNADQKRAALVEANEERCQSLIEQSLAMCTALAPEIGYEAAAKIAKDAYKTGKTVREMALEQKVLSEKRLEKLLDPWRMTEPGGPVGSAGG